MRSKFEGVFVPHITPFKDGELDGEALRRVVRYLLRSNVDGLVPTGTTGESATLSDEERLRVWELVIQEVAGEVPVIAGTGTNDTAHSVELTRQAEQAGADAVLTVAPYYNKPSQEGLLRHFETIASSTTLPVILYNIPSRTGVNIDVSTLLELSKIENIVGVKDAANNLGQLMDVIVGTSDFAVLSGEDYLLFSSSCLGGHGAIAASAHVVPEKFRELHNLVVAGRIDEARQLHYFLLPLIRTLFSEPNPAPIKGAYELLGLCSRETRLPIVPATEALMRRLGSELRRVGARETAHSGAA